MIEVCKTGPFATMFLSVDNNLEFSLLHQQTPPIGWAMALIYVVHGV